jgi:hypothetical protein
MRSFKILESCFQFFFPFREDTRLVTFTLSQDYDFKTLSSVQVLALRYIEENASSYILVFLPKASKNSVLPILEKKSQERFCDLGKPFIRVEVVDGGQKNLSNPPTPYLQDKWIATFENKTQTFTLLIPTSFLVECTTLLGFSWVNELKAENLKESPLDSLRKFENSILFGRCQFFENPLSFLLSLDRKFLSNLLAELLSKNLISYNHIASLHLFYGDKINFPDHLPKEIQNIVLRLSSSIQPFMLISNQGKYRWKRKLDYYLQNILSVLLIDNQSNKISYDTTKLEDFYFYLNESRLSVLNSITSAPKMIDSLINNGKVNELINNEGIDLLVNLLAFGEKISLESLFKKFKGTFQTEFNIKVESAKRKKNKIVDGKKKREHSALKLKFLQYLEDVLIKKYDSPLESKLSTTYIYETVRDLSAEQMCFLYNTLGFEVLSSLFQGLKYKEDSPLKKEEAESFLFEKISLLPTVEKEIIEDIFFERLNADRILNDSVIEKEFIEVARRIAVIEEMGGFKNI